MDMERLAIWCMGVLIGVLLRECFDMENDGGLDD
jgi:hypothetical protein